jgi:putative acetyltransferase
MTAPVPAGLRLRPACPEDATAIHAVHGRAIRGAVGHYTHDELEAWVGGRTPADYLAAIAGRHVVVAETVGSPPRVLGFGQLLAAEGVIEAVYVDPEAGRRGIGAALVAALEREARTRGARTLALEASLNSVPFYLAQGFDVDTAAQHALAPGVALRCMVMSKALVPTGSPCPTR